MTKRFFPGLVIILLFAAILSSTLGSCKHDPYIISAPNQNTNGGGSDTTGKKDTTTGTNWGFDTTLYLPAHPCSPDSVYFTNDIFPLISSNCSMAHCHDGASTNGDLMPLTNYVQIMGLVNRTNPAGSRLYTVLSALGEEKMPRPPGVAFTNAQKALILKWIQQGANNNSCDGDCDTSNVTFSGRIQPIITASCLGCHSATDPMGNVMLDTYDNIRLQVANGKLMGGLTSQAGFTPMPQNGALSPCDLNAFKIWIMHGAKNN